MAAHTKVCSIFVLFLFVCSSNSVVLKSKTFRNNKVNFKFYTSDYNYKTEYFTQKVSCSRGAFLKHDKIMHDNYYYFLYTRLCNSSRPSSFISYRLSIPEKNIKPFNFFPGCIILNSISMPFYT